MYMKNKRCFTVGCGIADRTVLPIRAENILEKFYGVFGMVKKNRSSNLSDSHQGRSSLLISGRITHGKPIEV